MRHYLVINPEDSIGKVFNLFERFKNLSKFGTIAVAKIIEKSYRSNNFR